MKRHRLRAPSNDGALLADPSLEASGALLQNNVGRLRAWDYDFQGRPASHLRAFARRQVLERARAYHERFGLDLPETPEASAPLILTGHQPELFHPGVWVKNFAVASLSRARQGIGLNLIVDNDLPKGSELRVPYYDQSALRTQRIPYDVWGGEIPFEDLHVRDESVFASFAGRVREVIGDNVPDPVIDRFWPLVLEQREKTTRVGARFALARRTLEASWGVRNLEVPLSDVCETEGFLWFAAHILAQLDRFQAVHNASLARYRSLYKIRSKHHPVPLLGREGEWREAPFWIWRGDEPRRRPLLARQLPRTIELRIGGEDRPLMEIPLGPDREACCAVEQLRELPAQNVRLRTRALTTTMFSRLLLGDLFVHGIGGAKYDELGDEVIRGFFGIDPPGYLTLSMTLWLGLRDDPSNPRALAAARRELRDLTYNPDRYLTNNRSQEVAALVQAKRTAVEQEAYTRQERDDRFHEIRRTNDALQPWVESAREELRESQERLAAGVHRNALAHSREFSFVLHSERKLRDAMAHAVVGTPAQQPT